MTTLYALLVGLTTLWTVAGIVAVATVRHRGRAPLGGGLSPVSVLKPLCGVDNDLAGNLRTFFEQDHPRFELVFGVQGEDDPALAVVRQLRMAYPDVAARIVVHDGGRGINPKVSNLRAMVGAATHDIVVISDSNIAVPPDYLRRMVSELEQPGVGLVTSLFSGTGERTLGATLESLHLNGHIASGVALPSEMLDVPIVVGKSMMFRLSVLSRLGGLESVANVLAEDYVIGRMFHTAGYRVRLCGQPIANVCQTAGLRAVLMRHVRWGMMRMRLAPMAFLLEPLAVPLAVALAAPLFGVTGPGPLMWAVGLTLARDSAQWMMLRGPAGLLRALPLFPLRDLMMLVAWVVTPFLRRVQWRGRRVRVSAGTRLYAEHEPQDPGAVMVER